MEKKVDSQEERKRLSCIKHKEIEYLRFEDLNENLEILKDQKLKQNSRIGEKHLALTAMINDKKQYLSSANDKMRYRIVKERQMVKTEEKPMISAQKQYLHPAAAVPDLVKWNPKEIKKLMQSDKKDN